MRLKIRNKRKRIERKEQRPPLVLRVQIVETQGIDEFAKFVCNPVCLVTTNRYYSKHTATLRNSRSRWNELLKLKLPRNPTSEWVRVIVYDALVGGIGDSCYSSSLQKSRPQALSALSIPNIVHSNSNSSLNTGTTASVVSGATESTNINTISYPVPPNTFSTTTTIIATTSTTNGTITPARKHPIRRFSHNHSRPKYPYLGNKSNKSSSTLAVPISPIVTSIATTDDSVDPTSNIDRLSPNVYSSPPSTPINIQSPTNAYSTSNLSLNTLTVAHPTQSTGTTLKSRRSNSTSVLTIQNNHNYYNNYNNNTPLHPLNDSSSTPQTIVINDGLLSQSQINLKRKPSQSTRKKPTRYLYIGETKVSLLSLFKKDKSNSNNYKFNVDLAWYKLYDRKREKECQGINRNPGSFVIGKIKMGFKLESSTKKLQTFDTYNTWRKKLFQLQAMSTQSQITSPRKSISSSSHLLPSSLPPSQLHQLLNKQQSSNTNSSSTTVSPNLSLSTSPVPTPIIITSPTKESLNTISDPKKIKTKSTSTKINQLPSTYTEKNCLNSYSSSTSNSSASSLPMKRNSFSGYINSDFSSYSNTNSNTNSNVNSNTSISYPSLHRPSTTRYITKVTSQNSNSDLDLFSIQDVDIENIVDNYDDDDDDDDDDGYIDDYNEEEGEQSDDENDDEDGIYTSLEKSTTNIDQLLQDYDALLTKAHKKQAHFDLTTLLPALDEYDVVEPDDMIDLEDEDLDNAIHKLSKKNNNNQMLVSHELEDDENEEQNEIEHEFTSSDPETDSEQEEEQNTDDIFINKSGGKKRIRRLKKKYPSQTYYASILSHRAKANYKLAKKQHAMGVVFVHFQSIKDLPYLKNKVSRTLYEMDPFIIATFARRVFKTSSRKHSLNPVFDEYAAFEVFSYERHFGFHFKVMDKDSFSYNDNIAQCELSWNDIMKKQNSQNDWIDYDIPLDLIINKANKQSDKNPTLSLKIKYVSYASLQDFFWQNLVQISTNIENFDIIQLMLFLDNLGVFTIKDACDIFNRLDKSPWSNQSCISKYQLVEILKSWKNVEGFRHIWKCPRCHESCKPTRNIQNSKLLLENDLITHFVICVYSQKYKFLKPSYVSTDFASKRWFTKVLIKLTYGKYALGSNNANILVQDRDSGIILEEKISAHVKLGIRILYNGKGTESKNFKALLRKLSIRQGRRFDHEQSAREIQNFIKFHSLDLSECLTTEYKTFNDFFYRKLKPGSRNPESDNPKIFISPADSRAVVFEDISKAKEIWIKGSKFTVERMTGGYKHDIFNGENCCLSIFRLAPQDYHRFHSPCNGKVGKPIFISGEYYTVNPMAIRSGLDVFGENVRVVLPIKTEEFGTILLIAVGAMMVGSIILTCKEGETITRGEEVGYFKFGGSTIITLIQKDKIIMDHDLVKNSNEQIETLVKVGMSIGHTPDIPGIKRKSIKLIQPDQIEKIKRRISITDEKASLLGNVPWQYKSLQHWIKEESRL
ncbi:hypothetical protein TBLA_0H02200 [Henningerozyma blattae CBS 6284]|uniref:Phosphatidylserine decarboxylase proenzyme 2 n=1 Tax=Henningerozyma blattae (strain ATCC 34711 / CBS 6284 / DSM 70876 / NBRC 10599 / NRRL Y-10934 / UCD 77-7) TaxID=1071380 RepID=I2H804_HENB6|nr:hypothetical protein TBLA_0H02200 [Tetrapisispora blattae CBS 6284]CCH62506.1 hypothetical protein TBLA_0H02200 [Tetrapisispora blattae CBS 6284]